MKNEIPSVLIDKYLLGTATDEEREQLLSWYRSQDHGLVEWPSANKNEEALVYHRLLSNIEKGISGHVETGISDHTGEGAGDLEKGAARETAAGKNLPIARLTVKRNYRWTKIAAAAAVFIIGGYALYFYTGTSKNEADKIPVLTFRNDVKPGGNKAILKLADGSEIDLNQAASKDLTGQKDVRIVKTADGTLVYTPQSNVTAQTKTLKYNTVSTPKGGQYKIVLPDGSKVWLNASSSIHFPTYFGAGERKVEISGEVYFEVTKNQQLPFRVISGAQELEVLGTQFNVDAYGDDQLIRTTLAKGSVRLNRINGGMASILKPGQQAQMTMGNDQTPIKIVPADVEEVLAWKNEVFSFNNTPFSEVMQQIERWYDVTPVYRGNKPDLYFTGIIPRSSNLSAFLRAIEGTGGVKFGIEGKNIIIYKLK